MIYKCAGSSRRILPGMVVAKASMRGVCKVLKEQVFRGAESE